MIRQAWLNLSLFKKLMAVFLGATLILVILMLGLARWSYEQGFFDYSNALEQTRLEFVAEQLAVMYAEHDGSFEAIPEGILLETIHSFPRATRLRPPAPPPNRRLGGVPPPPPPPRLPNDTAEENATQRESVKTAMFNTSRQFQLGDRIVDVSRDPMVEVPVKYKGQDIAILRSIPVRHFSGTVATKVSNSQWLLSGVVGGISLGVAAMVSFFLALVILRPIRRIMKAISALSQGDYSIKIGSESTDELGKLTQDVDHLAHTLESAQWSRKQWLANISHDMRTPLTVLTGEIQCIKDGVRAFDLERLLSMEQEVNQLRKFTEDVYELSLSDIGGLHYEFEKLDVYEVMQEAVAAMQTRADEKSLSLTLSGQVCWIQGDRARLLQLGKNLLMNSVDYTDASGRINVLVSAQHGKALLSIADTAPSVPAERCSFLFDPLYREDSSRNEVKKGGGLGLAICQNIVNAHQGSIQAQPSSLGGLEVRVELPLYSTS